MSQDFKDVIVLLPGITGSVLKKDGKDVWSPTAILRGIVSLGESLKQLELKNDDPEIDNIGDGIIADRLFPDIHLIPGLWKIDGYSFISQYLVKTFNLKPGNNFFEFPYDWRRDNRVTARRLSYAAKKWLNQWKEDSGNTDAKLILIAHSMGGLVARYFIEVLSGWELTRMLITFGTPYRGSLNALNFIANGLKKKIGPITLLDLSNMTRSYNSVYQLLPIYPCVDLGDGNLVRVSETDSIPNLNRSKAIEAIKFHNEINSNFQNHLNDEVYREVHTIYPIVGIFQNTLQSAILKDSTLEMLNKISGKDFSGDGTVPRVCAVPPVKNSQLLGRAISQVHGSLQNSKVALDQVEYAITGLSIPDMKFKDVKTIANIGMAVEDVYSSKELILLSVRCSDPSRDLVLSIYVAETGEKIKTKLIQPKDENWINVEIPSLKKGIYRIAVEGEGMYTIKDIFIVLDP